MVPEGLPPPHPPPCSPVVYRCGVLEVQSGKGIGSQHLLTTVLFVEWCPTLQKRKQNTRGSRWRRRERMMTR